MRRWVMAVAAAPLISCNSPETPISVPSEPERVEVSITVSVTPASSGELRFEALARNTGNLEVRYSGYCGLPNIRFKCFDSEENEIHIPSLADQSLLRCPAYLGTLSPGAEAKSYASFTGIVIEDGNEVLLPAGRYKVSATFQFSAEGSGDPIQASVERPFDWRP